MKEKISLRKTISNVWYATDLCMSISKSIVIHSFFLWLTGYFEWVFFDGIFFGLCSIYNNYVENVMEIMKNGMLCT